MKRRHLLQLAGTTLTTLGLNTLQIQRQSLHYARTLAQPTRRKRALLVGINEYPDKSRFTNLKGCVKDVEMQEQLLRHRFGFTDIETLLNGDATRDAILNTFEEFLIKPCGDDDVIVFHFSGHGRRVLDPDGSVRSLTEGETEPLNSTIVPADDDSARSREKVVSDIMGRTLFLLTSALKTPNVTIVLDSCYSGGGVRGNTRVRSAADDYSNDFDLRARPDVLNYQNHWMSRLNLTPEEVKERRDMGIAKGIALASARGNQTAVDASFDQFHAGAFTYFLTQYLWHEADSVQSVIANVSINLDEEDFKQRPLGCVAPASCNESPSPNQDQPIYFVDPQDTDATPAEAVLLNQAGDRATIWLGGSNPNTLITYGEGAEFTPVGNNGEKHAPVKVLSRHGLEADIQLSQPLPPGTRLQETIRVVPRNTTLRIGVDSSLEGKMATIYYEFEKLRLGDRFKLVLPTAAEVNGTTQYTYGDNEIHYILSRLTPEYRQFLLNPNGESLPEDKCCELPEDGSIVLLSAGIEATVPGAMHGEEEAIADIMANLKSTLTTLYAARFLKLAINTDRSQLTDDNPSRLNLDIRIRTVAQEFSEAGLPVGCSVPKDYLNLSNNSIVMIPIETVFQFEVTNNEIEDAVYLSILDIDQSGEIMPLLPNKDYAASPDKTIIHPGDTRIVPEPCNNIAFQLNRKIRSEFLIIVSKKKPREALFALREDQRASGLPLMDAFLADMSGVPLNRDSTAQQLSMSTADLAVFSIPFQVI